MKVGMIMSILDKIEIGAGNVNKDKDKHHLMIKGYFSKET